MRHYLSLVWCCLMLLVLSACEMRTVVDTLPNTEPNPVEGDYTMVIEVDWSNMPEDPTGMTLLFYPSDGSMPYMRLTNSVYQYVITLPEDDYKIIIFNQSETEFSFLDFIGLDKFETAEVHVVDSEDDGLSRIDRLFHLPSQNKGTRAKTNRIKITPNSFGSGTVTSSEQAGTPITRAKTNRIKVTPNSNVGQMSVTVRVQGLTREPAAGAAVAAVNGALTGLGSGVMLGSQSLTPAPLTQELDDWTINYCENGSNVGTITTNFGTFGISPSVDYTRSNSQMDDGRAPSDLSYVEESDEDDTRNILYLNFRLTDGTYVPYRFDVTHRIIERNEVDGVIVVSVVLELDLGIGIDGVDDGLDEPIILPPTGLPYTESGISVKNWGDTIYTVVPLK